LKISIFNFVMAVNLPPKAMKQSTTLSFFTSYDNISNTGLFSDALKIWRQKPETDKTYTLFCTCMTTEHEDRMRNQTTSQGAGYANNITETTIIDLGNSTFVSALMSLSFPLFYEGVDSGLPNAVRFKREYFVRPKPITELERAFVV